MSLVAHLQVTLDPFRLDAALQAEPGRVVALLGPNGAGKTTTLRALAGLQPLTAGSVSLDGEVLDAPDRRTFVPPEQRPIGIVHQDLLLFPHLDARDNVAFGLRTHGRTKAEARRLADAQLDAIGLGDHARSRPRALSGGQAQRVALARALAVEPRLLLLDEPLTALDATARGATRRDLRKVLDGFDGVTVVVTHDPIDALTLADDVVVLEEGRVAQAGSLAEVTTRPRTRHVADLLGVNLLRGDAAGTEVRVDGTVVHLADHLDGPVFVTIAPSAITVHGRAPEGSARNRWAMTVASIEPLGERMRLRLDGPVPLVAEITPVSLVDLRLVPGSEVWVSVKATEVHAYER
ncbi:ABC transporter ATP-binding protein [Aquihabitans sp. McL0605]|uniref:ABC transporter ATP-binding protein n=1 Tax=Aquihabitans sp. McL0605 TaxID=3415671 RepID=UPI003CED0DEB